MKIAVVGAGALGCLIAGLLKSKSREEVWLFARSQDTAGRINSDGIKIEHLNGSRSQVDIKATADPRETGPCDLVIVCVKSYSTEDVCKDIKEMTGDATLVLTLQNGLGNVQILNEHFGPENIVAGITNHGATLLEPGHVRHAGKGDTVIGKSDRKVSAALKAIAGLLTRCGLDTKVSRDIDSVIWSKLIVNVGINALTAITRLNNGRLLEYEELHNLLKAAVQEAVRVVKRKRVKLAYDDPIQKVESVCKSTATNVSSMLQDVLNRKRTEIDFINGAILRHAKAAGIPTPVNEALTNLVKATEASYEKAVRC